MRVRVSRLNNGLMVRCMHRMSSMGVWFFHIWVPQSMRTAAPGVIVLSLEGDQISISMLALVIYH
jgi:hypothetical protein